ncbi:Heat shock factor protein hsf8 [Thalictrum thalictroides]|uniref:Heat shock factor protein hsf8 n=1 Tax=Thalictrum thalictroides TaxID=46969 RepID=A0A7J6VRY0_THATH|nr:Heat shock factor protein hsf8 [Thalictrum thalictroides]
MTDSTSDKRPAPFLLKCYDMINDPSTDAIISWGSTDTSFVIWDMSTFEQELLPKYYKHNNFSSFMRQLNLYGFRKSDPDRWEFTHDGFIKGQKHILNNIPRKKSTQGNCQVDQSQENSTSTSRTSSQGTFEQNLSHGNITPMRMKKPSKSKSNSQQIQKSKGNSQQIQAQEHNTSASACVEVGRFGLWEEVEILKKDKNVVMQELAKLSDHLEGADGKLHRLGQRLQGMEISQQQMLSFLAMVVQSPGILGQLLQQNESSWRISETSKKRPYLALEQDAEYNEPIDTSGQIVKYQPLQIESPKPLLMPASNCDGSQQFDSSANGLDDFFMNIDLMSSGEGMPVPMEDNGHCGAEGQFVIPDFYEDGMLENLLLGSPRIENTAPTEPLETLGNNVNVEFTNHGSLVEQSQTLRRLTEELGLCEC